MDQCRAGGRLVELITARWGRPVDGVYLCRATSLYASGQGNDVGLQALQCLHHGPIDAAHGDVHVHGEPRAAKGPAYVGHPGEQGLTRTHVDARSDVGGVIERFPLTFGDDAR